MSMILQYVKWSCTCLAVYSLVTGTSRRSRRESSSLLTPHSSLPNSSASDRVNSVQPLVSTYREGLASCMMTGLASCMMTGWHTYLELSEGPHVQWIAGEILTECSSFGSIVSGQL